MDNKKFVSTLSQTANTGTLIFFILDMQSNIQMKHDTQGKFQV